MPNVEHFCNYILNVFFLWISVFTFSQILQMPLSISYIQGT